MTAADVSSYLTIPQLAQRLGCAHSTLYAQLKTGTFPYPVARVGADVRVPLEAVLLAESGVTTELAALREELAADRAERAAHRAAMAAIVGALAALFAPPPAVVGMSPTTTVQAAGERGEKSQEEENEGESMARPLPGRAAGFPIRQGGDQRGEAAHRRVQHATGSTGRGGAEGDAAPLRGQGKAKRPAGGTAERFIG